MPVDVFENRVTEYLTTANHYSAPNIQGIPNENSTIPRKKLHNAVPVECICPLSSFRDIFSLKRLIRAEKFNNSSKRH